MKKAIEKIVNSLVDSFNYTLDNTNITGKITDFFEFGTYTIEVVRNSKKEIGGEPDEVLHYDYAKIIVNSVSITNENSKHLTNVTEAVLAELDNEYTNY